MIYIGSTILYSGVGKKAILANSVAIIADKVFAIPAGQRMISVAWIGIIFYTFQIYFDFSGYSTMELCPLGSIFWHNCSCGKTGAKKDWRKRHSI